MSASSSTSVLLRNWRDHLPAGFMLIAWLCVAVHTCQSMSVTFDEIWHLPVGVRNLVDGDYAEDRLNPPLSRMWAAIPLGLSGVDVAPGSADVSIGERFVAEHEDFLQWYVTGRYFNLIWPLLTALLVYRVILSSHGLGAARLSLLAFLCCPDVIAHGSIVTPDSAAMFFFFATSVGLARWIAVPNWGRTITLGGLLGLLQAVKYTGVVFFPVVAVLGLWEAIRGRTAEWDTLKWQGATLRAAAILVTCLFSLAACYRFQGLFETWQSFALQSVDLRTLRELTGFLGQLPVPVPRDYLLGLDAQRTIMEGLHPTFLNGEWSLTGFHSYFLWALIYKIPLAVLGLAFIGCVVVARRTRQLGGTVIGAYLFPVLILLGIASLSSMQLGVRYVMPVLPLLACVAGASDCLTVFWNQITRKIAMCVVGLGLLSVWRFHPHHLSYFNELAGGPLGGRQHLIDSNIDWGQDLLRAKAVYASHPEETIRLAYFGTVDPRQVGIPCHVPPSHLPEPGLFLVSVSYVMGRPGTVREADGRVRSADANEYGYFRYFEPRQHVGYSLDLYRLTVQDCDRYRVEMELAE